MKRLIMLVAVLVLAFVGLFSVAITNAHAWKSYSWSDDRGHSGTIHKFGNNMYTWSDDRGHSGTIHKFGSNIYSWDDYQGHAGTIHKFGNDMYVWGDD